MDKVDGGASKPSAGQSRAETAVERSGGVNERIEFRGAVFEKVAGAFMALKHENAELGEVTVAERARAQDDPLDLANDMVSAGVFAFGKFMLIRREKFRVNRAESFCAQFASRRFAISTKGIVLTAHQLMLHASIGDDDDHFTKHRHVRDGVCLAIEFDSVESFSKKGRNLVEQPTL